MPATVTTADPRGLGYQTGLFSGPLGQPIDQSFFDAAFAGRINENKIYKEAYYCNIIGDCGMSQWLEQFTGTESDCYPDYTLLEINGLRQQIRQTVQVVIPAAPSTGTLTLSTKDHFVSGAYVLPQVGNTILLAPSGQPAVVTAVTHATANDTTLTVRLRDVNASAQTVPAGSEMLVLSGSEIEDCACPTGQFAFEDSPTEFDISMITFGDKGELCGDALNKCQYLKIPFYNAEGEEISGTWYTEAQRDMYMRFEKRKWYETLFNPSFGMIPLLRSRGIKFTPASNSEITTDDVRAWKQGLDLAGTACREYAIFAGREIYSQFQRMLLAAGVTQLDNALQPLQDCKWINMEYCGLKVEGLTLHIYDECTFSNGKELGAVGMNFPNSAIFFPMCNMSSMPQYSVEKRNGYNEKLFTRNYFRSNDGRVWDKLVDSNGVLNDATGGKNSYGAGCEQMEWTVKTRFANELHCLSSWGYIGLA